MTRPLLVLGRSGQVARELARAGAPPGYRLEFAGRDRLDLLTVDPGPLIERLAPAAVINAAAYTAVDRAEAESEAAFRLNRDAVGEVARACAAAGAHLVHLSTDYVFDGTKAGAYVESDARAPLGVYGRSKAQGEDRVIGSDTRWTILRTSWVYGAYGANFVRTMLRLARERDEIGVVADQHGRPTWSHEVARAALAAVAAGRVGEGLFHVAGEGDATWADLAEAVMAHAASRGLPSARINRIGTADFPTAARRPENSRLSSEKFARTFGWRPAPWRASVKTCLEELEAAPA